MWLGHCSPQGVTDASRTATPPMAPKPQPPTRHTRLPQRQSVLRQSPIQQHDGQGFGVDTLIAEWAGEDARGPGRHGPSRGPARGPCSARAGSPPTEWARGLGRAAGWPRRQVQCRPGYGAHAQGKGKGTVPCLWATPLPLVMLENAGIFVGRFRACAPSRDLGPGPPSLPSRPGSRSCAD